MLFEDIDECTRNETFILYKNKIKSEIYKWSKCAEEYSICLNRIGSYECKCLNGYQGDGFVCKDIDECDLANTDSSLIANCPLNSECINKLGTYECVCSEGFEKTSDKCQDINECERETHECQINSNCVNTFGSYRCVCKEGFRGNGVNCEG